MQSGIGHAGLRPRATVIWVEKEGSTALGSGGIRVNVVVPVPVWTPYDPAGKPAREIAEFGKDSAMGRWTQSEGCRRPSFLPPGVVSCINGIASPVTGGPKA